MWPKGKLKLKHTYDFTAKYGVSSPYCAFSDPHFAPFMAGISFSERLVYDGLHVHHGGITKLIYKSLGAAMSKASESAGGEEAGAAVGAAAAGDGVTAAAGGSHAAASGAGKKKKAAKQAPVAGGWEQWLSCRWAASCGR